MVKDTREKVGAVKTDGRTQRSARTRKRVVDAASTLFVDNGYLATTIEAVAESAGVAVQTVYYLFGTKRNLLARVLDATIAGDLEPLPIADRPWVLELRQMADATEAVERLVAETVAIVARAAPIYEVIRRASADPDVAELLDENQRLRRIAQRGFIDLLAEVGHLDSDVDIDAAADTFYALLNEEVFQLLVGVCEWDADRYCQWATALMVHQLVGGNTID